MAVMRGKPGRRPEPPVEREPREGDFDYPRMDRALAAKVRTTLNSAFSNAGELAGNEHLHGWKALGVPAQTRLVQQMGVVLRLHEEENLAAIVKDPKKLSETLDHLFES